MCEKRVLPEEERRKKKKEEERRKKRVGNKILRLRRQDNKQKPQYLTFMKTIFKESERVTVADRWFEGP